MIDSVVPEVAVAKIWESLISSLWSPQVANLQQVKSDRKYPTLPYLYSQLLMFTAILSVAYRFASLHLPTYREQKNTNF